MFRNLFILKRITYFWNKNNKFKSFINILSFSVFTLSITIIIITLCINDGFKINAVKKISSIDGLVRYYKKNNSLLNDDDYFYLKESLAEVSETFSLTRLITKECILKYNNYSEGIILKSIDNEGIEVFNLNDFLMHGTFDHNSIIIGQKLAEKLNLQLNDYVTLLNYSKNTINKFELLKIKVSGIYSTNIPSFDEYSIYGYTEMLQDFLDVKTAGYTTIVGQDKNYNFYNTKSINLNIDNYFSIDFDERHNFFLKWLNVYDVPIKLLLFFVFIISLINTISTSYLDILNRKNDIKKLYIIGYSRCFLKKIFLYKNIILSIFSLCFSIVLSFLFFSIQERFNLINIPSDIYFINKLPFNYDYLFLFTVLIFIFFVNIISSYLSISKIFKNTFFNSMSYD